MGKKKNGKKREIWRLIHDGYYKMSNCGRIMRIKPACGATVGRILQPYKPDGGTFYVCLQKEGERTQYKVEDLFSETFPYSR